MTLAGKARRCRAIAIKYIASWLYEAYRQLWQTIGRKLQSRAPLREFWTHLTMSAGSALKPLSNGVIEGLMRF